ncbi:MAG TPA: AAA family ATPase [Flavobacterium sp.]|nr:AAA family ATPase [Flavobacterium sp.]
MKNKRSLISLLEDSLSSLKDSIESEISKSNMVFNTDYIEQLRKEAISIVALCEVLNADAVFIQKMNAMVKRNHANDLLLKAEHFFISDIIRAYNNNMGSENEKSRFALAYYYDVLRNKHFADEKAIQTLNKLAASEEFKSHLQKIRSDNSIAAVNSKNNYFLLPVLTEMQHQRAKDVSDKMQQFLDTAFGENAKKEVDILNPKVDPKPENSQISNFPAGDTLEKVLAELHALIGLEAVKKDVNELINLLEIQKKRTAEGLKNIEVTLHTVFLGPPGTGKTSVARLLSRIYRHLGFLSQGQLYETDREGLIAGFVGQTAAKVDKAVTESLGGILFVDEAYALTQNAFGNDYGAEAVNTLLKRMEDHRDDFAVIVAGYTEPMQLFVESNPGLRSRYNRFFHFDHFTPEQLFQIFESFCKNSDFIITDDAKEKLTDTFELLYSKKDEGFGNARVVRNLFEKCVQNQANRIIKLKELSQNVLKTFTEEDIPEPKQTEMQVFMKSSSDNS